MPSPPPTNSDNAPQEAPHRLVCGRCKHTLEEVYPTRALADEHADEHATTAHAGEGPVVVLAVPVPFLESEAEAALEIAVGAQRRIDARSEDDASTT